MGYGYGMAARLTQVIGDEVGSSDKQRPSRRQGGAGWGGAALGQDYSRTAHLAQPLSHSNPTGSLLHARETLLLGANRPTARSGDFALQLLSARHGTARHGTACDTMMRL